MFFSLSLSDNQRFLGTERVKLSFGCKVKQLYVSVPNQIKMYILGKSL